MYRNRYEIIHSALQLWYNVLWWVQEEWTMTVMQETIQQNDRMKVWQELLEILAESDEDVRHGRTEVVSETFNGLRELLKEG